MFKHFFKTFRKKDDRTVRLIGKSCTLRTFHEGDAKQLAYLMARNKYFWSTYEPLQREDFYTEETQYKKIIESLQLKAMGREYTFGIFTLDGRQLIGHISLYGIKRFPYSSAFVGYAMDEHYTGKGIATEAVKLVIQFAFDYLNLHRIEAFIAPENKKSIRVVEKMGFQQEGLMRELLYINGKWVDHYMYALLQHERN